MCVTRYGQPLSCSLSCLCTAIPAVSEASTLRIGGLVSETGSAVAYGSSELNGLRLAVRVLNGERSRAMPRLLAPGTR